MKLITGDISVMRLFGLLSSTKQHIYCYTGEKDIFIENIEYPDKINDKELQADSFAVKWTLTEEAERDNFDN